MTTYAAETKVTTEDSQRQVEKLLKRYGASRFAFGWEEGSAGISFQIGDIGIRIKIPMPSPDDKEFLGVRPRTEERDGKKTRVTAYEQACRQRWRVLVHNVSAKLAAVEAGLSTLEEQFLADVILPSGETFGQWARPQLQEICAGKRMPLMLTGGDSK